MYTLVDIKKYVNDIEKFYAHIPSEKEYGKKPELLIEHLELSIGYFYKLCQQKGVGEIVLNIIGNMKCCGKPLENEQIKLVYDLFVNAIYLHDIGKINPAFQQIKMKNSYFAKYSSLSTNHSLLSAMMYIDIFQGEIASTPNKVTKNYFYNLLYSFAYLISKHHGSLDNLNDFVEKLDMQKSNRNRKMFEYYLSESIFRIPTENHGENNPFSARQNYYNKWNIEGVEFYILSKLLYSLIVSCDYYATYQYQNNSEVELGVIGNPSVFVDKYVNGDLYKAIDSVRKHVKNASVEELDINGLRSRMFIEAEQKLSNNLESNIFYMEAPTGGGKTNNIYKSGFEYIDER